MSRTGHLVGGLSRLHRYVQEDIFILAEMYTMVMQHAAIPITCVDIELPLANHSVIIPNTKIVVMGYSPPDSARYNLVNMQNINRKETITALNERINSYPKDCLFVAAGCSGIDLAIKIAKEVSKINIVISGCERIMQWNDGEPPEKIPKDSSYPLVIEGVTGNKVLVAHTYGTTKFIGKLQIDINEYGVIENYTGKMIYLNHTFPEGLPVIENILDKINKIELAKSRVFLSGNCTFRECNLGNLIADSFVDYKVNTHHGTYWTDTSIGIAVSGLHIRYDSRKKAPRKCMIEVRCSQCDIPSYRKLRPESEYQVITTNNILQGKFGHTIFANTYKLVKNEAVTDYHALRNYLKRQKFISIGRQERIMITLVASLKLYTIARKPKAEYTLWVNKCELKLQALNKSSADGGFIAFTKEHPNYQKYVTHKRRFILKQLAKELMISNMIR
ncbi:hypothetical protein QE152_g18973 [Popillia japonica]|uniref:5'-nucleotidase n=1 Tax=Popillia japonica TaxID=7064 RepID=A0AAW1L4W8_POPJA